MHKSENDSQTDGPRVFAYRGTIPPALALLLVAPMLLIFFSFAAMLLAGGTVGALVLPLLFRRGRATQRPANAIELDRDQYRRVDPDAPRLPRR
jgi:hypothetical protein